MTTLVFTDRLPVQSSVWWQQTQWWKQDMEWMSSCLCI